MKRLFSRRSPSSLQGGSKSWRVTHIIVCVLASVLLLYSLWAFKSLRGGTMHSHGSTPLPGHTVGAAHLEQRLTQAPSSHSSFSHLASQGVGGDGASMGGSDTQQQQQTAAVPSPPPPSPSPPSPSPPSPDPPPPSPSPSPSAPPSPPPTQNVSSSDQLQQQTAAGGGAKASDAAQPQHKQGGGNAGAGTEKLLKQQNEELFINNELGDVEALEDQWDLDYPEDADNAASKEKEAAKAAGAEAGDGGVKALSQPGKGQGNGIGGGAAGQAAEAGAGKAAAAEQAQGGGGGGGAQADDQEGRSLIQQLAGSGEVATLPVARRGRSTGSQMVTQTSGGVLYSWGLAEERLARSQGNTSVPEPALPSLRVISVAASRHSAIATVEGHVWTMGSNNSKGGGGHGSPPMDNSGQLGRNGTKKAGRVLGLLQGKFVVQVITGRYHTLAITDQGEVFSWGLNDWGQLGRQGKVGQLSASLPKWFKGDPTSPEVLGGQPNGECSMGAACHDGAPQRVTELAGKRIVGGSAGRYNTLVMDDQGQLYVWGLDGCATGKVPLQQDAWWPRAVAGALQGKKVVACDSGYTLWIVATSDGEVYTCSHQDDGYAGTLTKKHVPNDKGELGRAGDPLMPGKVSIPDKVVAVAAGREHGLAATEEGHVYSWGGRSVVAGRSGDLTLPARVLGDLQGDKILHVAGGEYFSLAASSTRIYGWGTNAYRSVGVGSGIKDEVPQPARAAGPLADGAAQVLAIAAGFQHSLAIAIPKAGLPASMQPQGTAPSTEAEQAKQQGQASGKDKRHAAKEQQQPGAARAESATDAAARTGGEAGTQQKLLSLEQLAKISGKQARQAAANSGSGGVGMLKEQAAGGTSSATPKEQGGKLEDAVDEHIQYATNQKLPPGDHVADVWARYKPAKNYDDIAAQSPDVFKALPKALDKQFKNPCWYSGTTLRCIPFFHVIGVSKCGTTDLYHRLSKHPEMFESRNKGPHWWDECPWPPKSACTAPPNGDFEGYIDLFRNAAAAIETNKQGITGEASSNTYTAARGVFLRGPSWDRDTKNVTLPDVLHEASPWLRLLLIFRDPVTRYRSAFYYYRWWKKDEPIPGADRFHQTVVEDIKTWRACVSEKGQAHCLRHYHPQQLIKGMYSEFLDDWLRVFPRSQLLILRNEDYTVRQKEHMAAIFKFLGMREPTEDEWTKIMTMPVRNANSAKYEAMRPDTRAMLEEFYAPFNKRLADLLGDPRWAWPKRRKWPANASSSAAAAL